MTRPLLLLITTHLLLFTTAWAQPTDINSLSWMSGRWVAENQEEQWSTARGQTILGYHRDFKGDDTVFFEFLRLEKSAEGITYWASPAGKSWTPFALASTGKQTALFSNPKHDFPREIRYRRKGDVMHVEISDGGSKRIEWEWQLSP